MDEVGQRQPDGADLLPPRGEAVDHPPGHHQVRLGVVVGEDDPLAQPPQPRRRARGGKPSDRAGAAVDEGMLDSEIFEQINCLFDGIAFTDRP